MIRRLFTVKNIALWSLISPACLILALALIPIQDQLLLQIAVAIGVLSFPFAYLGLAAIVAPLLPFHPMPAKQRLKRRDTWLRWGVACGLAYFCLTLPAAVLVLGPAVGLIKLLGESQTHHYLIVAILITPWCFGIWRVCLHIATRVALKRRAWLEAFLNDPTRG